MAIKKKDFVEVKYTGYSEGKVFDSNIEEDVKKLDPKAKGHETIVIVGEGMLLPGLDKDLEGKEIGKDYEVKVDAKDGFGTRDKNLVKTIPLKVFREKNVNPQPGMVFAMDNSLAKILAVSGARVTTDFNHPLANKELLYKYKIVRNVDNENEKCKVVFETLLRFSPEFEIKDKVIVKGPKALEIFVKAFNDKFKEFIGKDLDFELKETKKEDKHEHSEDEHSHEGHDHSHEGHEHNHDHSEHKHTH